MKYKITAFVVLVTASYFAWALSRPLPTLSPTIYKTVAATPSKSTNIKWPDYGGQAVGVTGYGVLATSGNQKPQPTASVAKVMVALAILNKKPLSLNQKGPFVPISNNDVAIYKNGLATYQSVVEVQVGEKLTQYQALQALLIASANNLAVTLTNWTFGSQKQYLSYANKYALELGMKHSHFADASGLSAQTVSTPADLVLLGEAAMQNPVIAKIVAQHSATIPVVGVIKNYNSNLTNGSKINGVKTGNTTEAGGCFLFSLDYDPTHKLIGVIMHAPTLGQALVDSVPLSKSLASSVISDKVVSTGQSFAYYKLPWGGLVDVTADQDLTITYIKGTTPQVKSRVDDLSGKYSTRQVGSVSFGFAGQSYESSLSTSGDIPKPSLIWRLLHP